MKLKLAISILLNTIVIAVVANGYVLFSQNPLLLLAAIPLFLGANLLAGILPVRVKGKRITVCLHGIVLLYALCLTVITSFIYQTVLAVVSFPYDIMTWVWSVVLCFAVCVLVFWNGIVCVYLTSTQLGIKWRVGGIVFGMVPLANVIVLFFILKKATTECLFEIDRTLRNNRRKEQRVCETKYPILMVHGVFFRDVKAFPYWGRIPKELEANGATLFFGNQPSADSVANNGAFLKNRIEEVLKQTGAEKVNIIAHSKGGLDCRYVISLLGMAEKVASLTTINTPHKGCLFADYLLNVVPNPVQKSIAGTYNTALRTLGEPESNFMAAVTDLTDTGCKALNEKMPTVPSGVYCQSVGSVMPKPSGGQFPLNLSYRFVNHFSGRNDGLVSEDSFAWGEKYILLTPKKKRGISHGDVIDLNRENIPGFDVREFYVTLVSDLKNRGL